MRSKWFLVLLAHAALVQAVTFILRPMTSYRALDLGISEQYLGLMAASFALVPLVLALPTGRATDRLGEKPVVVSGALLVALSASCFLLANDSVVGLLLGSFVLGTGQLLSMVGGQAIAGNVGAREGALDSAFGYYTFAASLGQTAGPLFFVLVGGEGTSPEAAPVFATAAVLALATVVAALAVRPPARETVDLVSAPPGLTDVLRIPGLKRALFAAAIILSAVDILIVYLPALGASAGLAAGTVGLLLAIRSGASMISRLFMGPIAARLGRGTFLLFSTIASAFAVLVAGLPVPPFALVAAVVVAGFCLGVGQPLTMSWLAEVAPPGLRGTALSLRLVGNRLGQVIVPSLAGLAAGGAGASGVLAFTAVTLVVAAGATSRGGIGLSSGPD